MVERAVLLNILKLKICVELFLELKIFFCGSYCYRNKQQKSLRFVGVTIGKHVDRRGSPAYFAY